APPRPHTGAAWAALLRGALRAPRHGFLSQLAGRPVSKSQAKLLAKLDDIASRAALLRLLRLSESEVGPRLRHLPRLSAANAEALGLMPGPLIPAFAPMLLGTSAEVLQRDLARPF